MDTFKRVISLVTVFTFIFSLGPLPSAMALRQDSEGNGVGKVGEALKAAATPAGSNIVAAKYTGDIDLRVERDKFLCIFGQDAKYFWSELEWQLRQGELKGYEKHIKFDEIRRGKNQEDVAGILVPIDPPYITDNLERQAPGAWIGEDSRLNANSELVVKTYMDLYYNGLTFNTLYAAAAPAAGLDDIRMPSEIREDIVVGVKALEEKLPVMLILKGKEDAIECTPRPTRWDDYGYYYSNSDSSEGYIIAPVGTLAYFGADVRSLAENQKALIIANSKEDADAKKDDILRLKYTGLQRQNIITAASVEEVKAALQEAETTGVPFAFVITVDPVDFLNKLEGLGLPVFFMSYVPAEFGLRDRLAAATLASAV